MYQIYPRSFCDTTGDGVGDLGGVRRHLDHLAWLGVDALWLSPIYRSPMADYGYDVADHCDVDPLFGSLDDLDRLVAEAHARDLRVVLDWVPNHTSDRHPWFVDARRSRDAERRDWYVWRDGDGPDRPPNNWLAAFPPDTPAWTWDERTGQHYLHLFLPEQPDLDWDHPDVEAAMHDVLRFWLDRGVDGFRADVVHLIGKDPELPDLPDELAAITPVALNDHPSTHERLRRIRTLLDGYGGDRMMVGEVDPADTRRVATYYGHGDELHLVFNFSPLYVPWEAEAWHGRIARVLEEYGPRDAWPTWVLSNHDNPRHRTRYGSEARARAAAVLLLTLRGTPFLFAGEELGLEDAEVPPQRVLDPGGHDGCRAPLPWTARLAGAGRASPGSPGPPTGRHATSRPQRADPGSVLHLYRQLLRLRRRSPALHRGDLVLDEGPEGVLVFHRRAGAERLTVAVNFTDDERPLPGRGTRLLSTHASDDREAGPPGDVLVGNEAVVLGDAVPG
ncbi:MAG: alpha-amylase family glycosyl hydrolase [Acidimicrobiia bacterium]|nr:alpha-amylase family glycosyl hydrolase [Acidimicrobiia bacterium]